MITSILIILCISCTITTHSSEEPAYVDSESFDTDKPFKPRSAGQAPPPDCYPGSASTIKDDRAMIHRLRYIGNLPEKKIKENEDACVGEAKILFKQLYGEDAATKAEIKNFMRRPVLVETGEDLPPPQQDEGSKPSRWTKISGNNLIYWLSKNPGRVGFQPDWYWKAYAMLADDILNLQLSTYKASDIALPESAEGIPQHYHVGDEGDAKSTTESESKKSQPPGSSRPLRRSFSARRQEVESPLIRQRAKTQTTTNRQQASNVLPNTVFDGGKTVDGETNVHEIRDPFGTLVESGGEDSSDDRSQHQSPRKAFADQASDSSSLSSDEVRGEVENSREIRRG